MTVSNCCCQYSVREEESNWAELGVQKLQGYLGPGCTLRCQGKSGREGAVPKSPVIIFPLET